MYRVLSIFALLASAMMLFAGMLAADAPSAVSQTSSAGSGGNKPDRSSLSGEQINWQVVSPGGTDGSSENYQLMGTVGQTATGDGLSSNYGLFHGYWQDFGANYVCGDADASGYVDIDDAVFVIAYIFAAGPPPNPLAAGDADCSGNVDIDDVVYLINYIFGGGPPPCDPDDDGVPDC
jgi:hypothetical protein